VHEVERGRGQVVTDEIMAPYLQDAAGKRLDMRRVKIDRQPRDSEVFDAACVSASREPAPRA
jgi:hypothetical protein